VEVLTGRIRLLDPHTVNQIAAGEVVERPAAALKELLENALDAAATRIEIDLVDSGRTMIRVSDNGIGMTADEARQALQRHATSKIATADDLTHVKTLGFRGEALPSIASVSRMTLSTAVEDGLRTVYRIENSNIEEAAGTSGPRGTEITVEDLFYNTPARLKFLKSDTTELGACLDVISRYAIAYPWVALVFRHNQQIGVETTGSGDMLEAISSVWSRELARSLAEVRTEAAGIKLHGFVSPPHVTRHTRSYQYLTVNGRPVRTRTLTVALDQAYRDLTPEKRYPIVALNLEIDPAKLDVNVSPTKSEVKFQQEGAAFDALRVAVKSALMEHGMMPEAGAVAAVNEALSAARPSYQPFHLADLSYQAQSPLSTLSVPMPESGLTMPAVTSERLPFIDLLDGLRVIGQAMNTFIIAETAKGIVIIDQHVAHERILYEYLCGIRGKSAIEKQALLVPVPVHLDKRAAVLFKDRMHEVEAVGFDLEAFGGDSYLIRAAPAALKGKDPAKVLRDLIDELVESCVTRRLAPTREQIWIMSSCKMAVKAGDPLSMAEMEKLILDLSSTENPYLCPHGRPITITLGVDDLLRKFKRT
jgi:DNA mismatch repair protein MutL